MEISSLERLKIHPYTYNIENTVFTVSQWFYLILLILAGNEEIIKSLDEINNALLCNSKVVNDNFSKH